MTSVGDEANMPQARLVQRRRLKRELQKARTERYILKKVALIFGAATR